MNVLITGGAGAIGGNVVRRLVEDPDVRSVIVLDDLSSGYLENLPVHPKLKFVRGSITDDEILKEIFASPLSHVCHLAANFANQNSVDYPRKDLEVNGMGTLKVLEYAHSAGISRFVYSSSSCVYGNKGGVLSEDTQEFSLDTPYAITKLLGERYIRFFHDFYKMDTVILRFFNAYGPGERPGKYRNVIPNFIQCALQGQPLPITGDGTETRDFNFNSHIVDGVLAALKIQGISGGIFNIASGVETPILRVAELINETTGNRAGIEFKPRRNWDSVARRLASIEAASKYLAYCPSVSLEQGIRQTVEWIRAQHLTSGSY